MSGNVVDFIGICNDTRKKIKEVATHLKKQIEVTKMTPDEDGTDKDKGEMIANLMLTYRHLEDANMRLGKAIQAMVVQVFTIRKPQ